MTLTLPPITIPAGSERDALNLLQSVAKLFQFGSDAAVNPDTGKRAVAVSIEHSLTEAAAQLEASLPA